MEFRIQANIKPRAHGVENVELHEPGILQGASGEWKLSCASYKSKTLLLLLFSREVPCSTWSSIWQGLLLETIFKIGKSKMNGQ